MAKKRRVIRKLRPAVTFDLFDDQAWPVNVALVVLGGVLNGLVLGSLEFDAPQWYLRPWLWLVTVTASIIGMMYVLRYVQQRVARRSLQFAFIISLAAHVVLLLLTLKTYFPQLAVNTPPPQPDPSQRRHSIRVPEYVRPQSAQSTPQVRSFDRPVRTEPIDPDTQSIDHQRPDEERQPLLVQPTPVPQPEETIRPQPIRRETIEEVSPRLDNDQSILSRQVSAATPTPRSAVQSPAQPRPTSPRDPLRAVTSEIQRTAPAAEQQRSVDQEPADAPARSLAEVSRQTQSTPAPQTTLAPAAPRATDQSREAPRSLVAVSDTPSIPQGSPQARVEPSQTAADRPQTASPHLQRDSNQPAPDVPSRVTSSVARRQHDMPSQPTIARTPVPVDNQRSRITERPETSSTATIASPQPRPAAAPDQVAAANAGVSRPVPAAASSHSPSPASSPPEATTSTPARRQPRADQSPRIVQHPQPQTTPREQRVASPSPADTAANPAVAQTASTTPQPAQVDARRSPVQRTNSDTQVASVPRTSITRETIARPSTNVAPLARQEASDVADPTATRPEIVVQRQTAVAAANSSTAAQLPASLPTNQQQTQVAARSTAPSRHAAANSPVALENTNPVNTQVPEGTTARSPDSLVSRRPLAQNHPLTAHSPQSELRRSTDPSAAVPQVASVPSDAPSPASPRRSPETVAQPSDSTIARQFDASATATRNQPASDRPAVSSTTQLARPLSTRSDIQVPPSIENQSPSATPRRAQDVARVATATASVERPSVASTASDGDRSAVQPAATSLAQGRTGVAGVGASMNLSHATPTTNRASDADDSASVRAALQPSASAQRPEATQSMPDGPALSPSSVAEIRRSRAMSPLPSSIRQVQTAQASADTGADRPDVLTANSSAALTQAASNARTAESTAAKGSAEADLGTTRLVSDADRSRADPTNLDGGGGQPMINPDRQTAQVSRTEVGDSAVASLVAAQAEATAAPSAQGGLTTATLPSLAAAALVRSETGADSPISGGPARADQGPPDDANAAPQIGEAALSRTTLAETAPGSINAGGGDPTVDDPSERVQRIARSTTGGAPRVAASALAVAPTESSPDNARGGELPSAVTQHLPQATSPLGAPLTGGPNAVSPPGPVEDEAEGERVTQLAASRSPRSDAVSGPAVDGGGQPDQPDLASVDPRVQRADRVAMRRPVTGSERLAATDLGQPDDLASNSSNQTPEDTSVSDIAKLTTDNSSDPGDRPSTEDLETDIQAGELVASDSIQRAEAVAADQGQPVPGAGTDSPQRSGRGPELLARTQAVVPQAAASQGAEQARPLAATGSQLARRSGGFEAPATLAEVGAELEANATDARRPGRPGPLETNRSDAGVPLNGPELAQAGVAGRLDRQGPRGPIPAEIGADVVAQPTTGGPTGDQQVAAADAFAESMAEVGPMSRNQVGGVSTNVPADDGPGGLGDHYSIDIGINNRRARSESVEIHNQPVRFVREHIGGRPDLSTAAIVAAEPFRNRGQRMAIGDGSGPSADPQTELAIELGLEFLSRHQGPEGSWSLQAVDNRAAMISDTAATALALMAFQGAGYNHKEHKYAEVVDRGIQYLLQNQVRSNDPAANGELFSPPVGLSPEEATVNAAVRLYSHAIATLALCEAYGMTQDPELREAAQAAIKFIENSQHAQRGGWRYTPGQGSDTSVTGWMMMALESGQLANLQVQPATFERIDDWLDKSQASEDERHLYRYNPYAPDTEKHRHGRTPSKTMTSVGLLMRLYSGWDKNDPWMQRGADYLLENLPSQGTVSEPERDTYYWYYATQVMFHMGGEHWRQWNAHLHPLLVSEQIKRGPLSGSWDPYWPVPDRWAGNAGRIYVTTMNLLSLEVHYRHLPLYEEYGDKSVPPPTRGDSSTRATR